MKTSNYVYVTVVLFLVSLISLGAFSLFYLYSAEANEKNEILSLSKSAPLPTTRSLPSAIQIPESKPVIAFVEPGVTAVLPSAKWIPQTFNNCGPAATSMVLQYFGYSVSQAETKKVLRTNPKDSNVFAYEIGDYLRSEYGIESKLMFNGNLNLLKTLLANGFYVVVEGWLRPYEDIGHNMVIRGYDDSLGVLIADDPYHGVGVKYKYADFDAGQWKPFNREFLPVYLKEKEDLLRAIVGENWDERIMFQNSVKDNEAAVIEKPRDMYSYFNLGTSYYALGSYIKAKEMFEKSKSIGWPMRMLWYQYQPVQTYNQLGEYQKALDTAAIALKTFEAYPELHLELAIAYRGLGKYTMANKEIKRAIELAPNWEPAKNFLAR